MSEYPRHNTLGWRSAVTADETMVNYSRFQRAGFFCRKCGKEFESFLGMVKAQGSLSYCREHTKPKESSNVDKCPAPTNLRNV